jgi:putative ABC transport system permease protein
MSVIASLRPMVIYIQKQYLTEGAPVTYIKINSQDKKKTVEFIEQKWNEHIPSYPFEYQFLEDFIAGQYDFPKKLHKIFELFSILCIFISSLGLFGLSSFVTERRTKEIGIRKVYGASVRGIVISVSYSFLKLILLSGIIGSILFNLSMGKMGDMWKYSPEINLYNINITIMVIVLLIAFITVSYHAIKAALTDPVKTLRYE